MRMKHTIRERWVEALRSGKYRKAHGALGKMDAVGPRYCALGVLCELAIEDGVEVDREVGNEISPRSISYDGSTGTPPTKVLNWAGISHWDPWIQIDGMPVNVTTLNDQCKKRLDEIAKLIDSDPERGEDLPD